MLIDRHRTAALVALSELANAPAEVRDASKEALQVLTGALYEAATLEARQQFVSRVTQVPLEERPWAYVRRPSPDSAPPLLVLLLGQQDEDPDSSEDGNRLPNRSITEHTSWLPLYAAFDRWDTAVILEHIGPMGWMLPPDNHGIPRDHQAVESPPQPALTRSAAPEAGGAPAQTASTPTDQEWRQLLMVGAVTGVQLGVSFLFHALTR